MQGAREYAELFSTGRHGRLFLLVGSHARGKTFQIYVLPEGAADSPLSKDAVEVYGITGGQPGWTETYGWLHRGKWEGDFAELVASRRSELAAQAAYRAQRDAEYEASERTRKAKLLAAY